MNIIDWNKEKENLKHKFEEEKLSIDEVADQYNVSVSTVWKKCKSFGIKVPSTKSNIASLSEEEKLEFKRLFESGKSSKELKKLFNLSEYSFYSLVSNLNLKRGKGIWSDEEISELRECLNKGLSYSDLEEIFKGRHSIQSISGIIRYRGDKLGLKYSGHKRHQFIDKDFKDAMELRSKGKSWPEISKILNIPKYSLSKYFSRNGGRNIASTNNPNFVKGVGIVDLSEENIRRMIEIEGMTRKQVAKELGISKDTLKRRMDKFGIKIEKPEKIIPDRPLREHKLKVLRRYLGHYDLTDEEEKLRFIDVIKKEDLEKALSDNNYFLPKAAKDLWISVSVLADAMKKHGIKLDLGPRISDYSEEFYRKAYVEDGLTYVEVAEIVGLSTDTVRKYLKRTFPDAGKLGKYQSIGELLVAKALESLGIKFKYNVRYKGYNKKDPNRLYIIDFEFFYHGKKYWIEYNGKQHYEFVEYFYKTEENFKERLERDRFVSEELTKLVGTNLIIIRYDTESIENDIKVSLGIQ